MNAGRAGQPPITDISGGSSAPLAFTIIRAADASKVLAKRIERDATSGIVIKDFDQVALFTFERVSVPDLRSMGRALYKLARNPHAAIVRGDLLPHVRPGIACRRRARAGDGTDTLTDCARAWIAVDMDDVQVPAGLDWRDAEAVALHLQTLLLPELHGCDCLLVWSAKQGFRAPGTVRCKMFFALTAPVPDEDLRRWALVWNAKQGAKIIDPALFNPAQLHYIANPIIAPGIADPLTGAGRWHWVPGMFGERATIVVPSGPAVDAVVAASEDDSTLVRTVVTAGAGLHEALVKSAARHIGRGMAPASVMATLYGMMDARPEAERDARWRERRAEIPRIVDSAARKFGTQSRKAFGACAGVLMMLARRRCDAGTMRAAALNELTRYGVTGSAAEALADTAADWCRRKLFPGVAP
jgi:hypothetical protein